MAYKVVNKLTIVSSDGELIADFKNEVLAHSCCDLLNWYSEVAGKLEYGKWHSAKSVRDMMLEALRTPKPKLPPPLAAPVLPPLSASTTPAMPALPGRACALPALSVLPPLTLTNKSG